MQLKACSKSKIGLVGLEDHLKVLVHELKLLVASEKGPNLQLQTAKNKQSRKISSQLELTSSYAMAESNRGGASQDFSSHS